MFKQFITKQITQRKMKLAEGLLLRADLKKKIEHLQNRIRPVLIVSDGRTPQEDPVKLMAQLRKTIQDFETIVVRINRTNNQTFLEGEGTLMEALAKRDSLKILAFALICMICAGYLHSQTKMPNLKISKQESALNFNKRILKT